MGGTWPIIFVSSTDQVNRAQCVLSWKKRCIYERQRQVIEVSLNVGVESAVQKRKQFMVMENKSGTEALVLCLIWFHTQRLLESK